MARRVEFLPTCPSITITATVVLMNISLTGFPAYIALVLFFSSLAILPMYLLSKARRKTYEFTRQYDTIVVTGYEAPHGLTPAEIGYLTDAKFSKREFYATILDLEQKGFIEIEKSGIDNYRLTSLLKDDHSLKRHERLLIDELTSTNSFSCENRKILKKFRESVLSSLVKKGLVKSAAAQVSFLASRIIVIFLALNTLLTLTFLISDPGSFGDTIVFLVISPLLFSPITFPIAVILGYTYHKIVGETGLWTKKMKDIWVDIAGYKHFVQQVDLDNIQFESADLKSKTKIKAFPYAVGLGLDTKWQKRFHK
jgi:hypothetical protein